MAKRWNASVLIVEDNREDAVIMRKALETLRIKTTMLAETAEEALEQLERGQPDAVLVDYLLPGMNGLRLVERIREQWPDIKVVVVTGLHDEDVAVAVLKAGADDYVSKDKLLTSRVIRSLQVALRRRIEASEQQRRQILASGWNNLDVAFEEAEWQHEVLTGGRGPHGRVLAGLDLIAYGREDAVELAEEFATFLRRSFELFPEPARIQEDRLAGMFMERGVSAAHVLGIYRAALRLLAVDEVEPAFNPSVCLTRVLALLVDRYQYRVSAEALQTAVA